jgi:hypothetical protein
MGSVLAITSVFSGVRATLGQVDPSSVQGDLTPHAHIFLFVATAVALVFILRLLRRRRMNGKYALLWTVVAVLLGVLAIWPGLLTRLSEWVGVYYPPALFLLLTTGFLFIVVIQFSYELSRLEDRSRTLAEELALLRAEREGTGPSGSGPANGANGTGGTVAPEGSEPTRVPGPDPDGGPPPA